MRLALIALVAIVIAAFSPTAAQADVTDCGGQQPLGLLTCTTTGPAMINGTSFVGDGGSSAQMQWTGIMTVAAPGTLTMDYTYTDIYNTLFAKLGMRLTINQPGCADPHESHRDWADPETWDGVAQQMSIDVTCAGPVNYTITSRAATYSLEGSFIGDLATPTLTFTADAAAS